MKSTRPVFASPFASLSFCALAALLAPAGAAPASAPAPAPASLASLTQGLQGSPVSSTWDQLRAVIPAGEAVQLAADWVLLDATLNLLAGGKLHSVKLRPLPAVPPGAPI